MDKFTGKKLDGRYEIHELIGEGGMANVYRAYDTIDDRTVAIKILKEEFSGNSDFIRRFKNESKAIALLSHPNIVQVYDVSFGDVIQYIVVEHIDGITLKEYIEMQRVVSFREAVHFTVQILKALEHAHSMGIIHRDIKPQNILLLEDGTIKVTDFGIARFSNADSRTMTEKAIGSVHYISPEQARGEIADQKSDIYSVGVILYEMLTGSLPFDADSAVSVALMQLQKEPRRPKSINPEIPDGLEQIIIKAMQKNPSGRYATATDMLDSIEKFRQNPDIKFEYQYVRNDQRTKYVDTISNAKKTQSRDYNDNYVSSAAVKGRAKAAIKRKSPFAQIAFGIILSAVIVAVVFVVLAFIKAFTTDDVDEVYVPDLVGRQIMDIKSDKSLKFNFVIQIGYDGGTELGAVLEQDPPASTKSDSKKVKATSTIVVTVNSTEIMKTVPLVNRSDTEEKAIEAIEKEKLTPEILYIASKEVPVGYCVDTYPKAGVEMQIGSSVRVYVSKGIQPAFVSVPNLRNMTIEEAKTKLKELKFETEVIYDTESRKTKNTVINQAPLVGSRMQEGSKVIIVVAKGIPVEKSLGVSIEMPTQEKASVPVKILVDGKTDEVYSRLLVPSNTPIYNIAVKGKTTSTVIVEIDGQLYREYKIDFENEKITTLTANPYTPRQQPTTETATTTPPETTVPPNTQATTAQPTTSPAG